MEDLIERLNNELSELRIKQSKLADFLSSDARINNIQRSLLIVQNNIMISYIVVLEARISFLP